MFEKPFWTIKNGGMFGDDDRVLTLMDLLDLNDRLIPIEFDSNRDYLAHKDYAMYRALREDQRKTSLLFLREALSEAR